MALETNANIVLANDSTNVSISFRFNYKATKVSKSEMKTYVEEYQEILARSDTNQ